MTLEMRHSSEHEIATSIRSVVRADDWTEFDLEPVLAKFIGIRLRRKEARRAVNAALAELGPRAWSAQCFAVRCKVMPDDIESVLMVLARALAIPASRPITPRLVCKALGITNRERLRWTKDRRLPQSGSVSIRRAQIISVPTYSVRRIQALADDASVIAAWRDADHAMG